MKTLLVLNDAPYGSERTYNGARLAGALSKQVGNEVRVFLIGDAASAAHRLQKVPSGDVGVCGTCMDARGISADDLITGAHRSSMDELTQWTAWADKVLVF